MDGRAFIFLNGLYPKGDDQLVRRLIRKTRPRPVLIAVDGGIAFLQKNKLKPDYWISDLDSTPRIKRGFLRGVELMLFPADKDKTDAELAVDFCADEGLFDLTVFGWEARKGETDHLLGTLMLCRNLKGKKRRLNLRFLDNRQEVYALHDNTRILKGYKGKRLSVIPLSSRIVLTLQGAHYSAREMVVYEGETISMRNRITAQRAKVSIKGKGLIVIS
jgi:thiamine pyrophosphokinase